MAEKDGGGSISKSTMWGESGSDEGCEMSGPLTLTCPASHSSPRLQTPTLLVRDSRPVCSPGQYLGNKQPPSKLVVPGSFF